MTLIELRDALQTAKGPSFDLDRELWNRFGPDGASGPAFTRWYDMAALLEVPEISEVVIRRFKTGGVYVRWSTDHGAVYGNDPDHLTFTVPLAMCIARVNYEIAKAAT